MNDDIRNYMEKIAEIIMEQELLKLEEADPDKDYMATSGEIEDFKFEISITECNEDGEPTGAEVVHKEITLTIN